MFLCTRNKLNEGNVSEAYFSTALICLNGLVVSSMIEEHPEELANFCRRCGSRALQQCPRCQERIKGIHWIPGQITNLNYRPPTYCDNCGCHSRS